MDFQKVANWQSPTCNFIGVPINFWLYSKHTNFYIYIKRLRDITSNLQQTVFL